MEEGRNEKEWRKMDIVECKTGRIRKGNAQVRKVLP